MEAARLQEVMEEKREALGRAQIAHNDLVGSDDVIHHDGVEASSNRDFDEEDPDLGDDEEEGDSEADVEGEDGGGPHETAYRPSSEGEFLF